MSCLVSYFANVATMAAHTGNIGLLAESVGRMGDAVREATKLAPWYLHDGTGVVHANAAAARLFGTTVDRLVGRHPMGLIAPAHHAAVLVRRARLFQGLPIERVLRVHLPQLRSHARMPLVDAITTLDRFEGRTLTRVDCVDMTLRARLT